MEIKIKLTEKNKIYKSTHTCEIVGHKSTADFSLFHLALKQNLQFIVIFISFHIKIYSRLFL